LDLEFEDQGPEPGAFYRLAWFFYLALALGGALWVGWGRGEIPLELFVDFSSWWIDLGLGVGAGLALVAAWGVGHRLFSSLGQLEREIRRAVGPLESGEAIALALISGFAEEFFFRGAMQSSWGWEWGVVIFALLHASPGTVFGIWMVYALFAGALFAGLTLWRDNISAAFLAHFLVNAIHLRRIGRLPDTAEPE